MPVSTSPDASGFVQICPQSPRHRVLENRQIEIEGEGVPLATANNWADASSLLKVHEQFGPKLAAAADRYGIPYELPLAIATVEGGWMHPDQLNSAHAGGVMALTPIGFKAVRGYSPSDEEMLDIDTNIDVGVALLAKLWAMYNGQIPAIAVSYNAGSPRCSSSTQCKSTINGSWDYDGTSAENSWGMVEDCTQGKNVPYARRAVALYNSAIAQGLSGGAGGVWGKVFFCAIFAAIAFVLSQKYHLPEMLLDE